MTITPFADAARKSVDQVRALYELRNSQDLVQRIRERMSTDVSPAALMGMAELLDLDVNAGRVGTIVCDTLAATLASIALTLSGGNEAIALVLVDHFTRRLQSLAQTHVRAAPENATVGAAVAKPMAGRA